MLDEFIHEPRIAYFSMEIALRNEIPTYSGGLGVLAGDTLRSAADLELPMVAVTLVSREGYFHQEFDAAGRQTEQPDTWEPEQWATPLAAKVALDIEGRQPIILLDTNLEENRSEDRTITDALYGGDDANRLKQEMVLGIGGIRLLQAVGFVIRQYHMNEGHSALLALELLRRHAYPAEDLRPGESPYDLPREHAKRLLIDKVAALTSVQLNAEVPTLGFARRMTAYKRPDLLFTDLERIKAIAQRWPFQIILAGKAHPRDEGGKHLIEVLHRHIQELADVIPIVFLPGYDMEIARTLVAGVDIWLNTPLRPHEASGTSGMKATFNGVPNLSVLDGWWIEGCIEGITGWSVGNSSATNSDADKSLDTESLYTKLEHKVLPLYYEDRDGWIRVMKGAIAKNAAFFNSHRMMRRYATEAYIR